MAFTGVMTSSYSYKLGLLSYKNGFYKIGKLGLEPYVFWARLTVLPSHLLLGSVFGTFRFSLPSLEDSSRCSGFLWKPQRPRNRWSRRKSSQVIAAFTSINHILTHTIHGIFTYIWLNVMGKCRLVGGWATHLKNMRKSTWISSPNRDENEHIPKNHHLVFVWVFFHTPKHKKHAKGNNNQAIIIISDVS